MSTEILKTILNTLKKENALNAGGEISGATARDIIDELERIIPIQETYFPVLWVAREDIERAGYESLSMSDDDMRSFADEMSNDIETSMDFYWDSIRTVCRQLNMKEL